MEVAFLYSLAKKENMNKTKRVVLSAMFLAIAMVLPSLFGGAQPILQRISPMHLPMITLSFLVQFMTFRKRN